MGTSSAHDLTGRQVLVTGASGFIGQHLCRRLLARGARVHAVSRSARASQHASLRWWQGDLAEIDAAKAIMKEARPEIVFHLASHVMGAPAAEHVLPTFRANLQTTVNLLVAALDTPCRRLVLTGSLVEPDPGTRESVPPAPYAAAKWAASDYGRMFHALYGVPVAIARVFMVYGPGQHDHSKLIPYVILSALNKRAPRISSGRRLIDWVYVEDVVEGFLALGVAPGIEGSTLDLGSGALVSIRDIVNRTLAITDRSIHAEFGAIADRPLEPHRVADTDATFRRVGWRPKVGLDEGLRRTAEWFRSEAEKPTPPVA